MTVSHTERRFRPGVWGSVAVVLLAPLFAGLGYWQLQRAAEKEAVLAAREHAQSAATLRLIGDEDANALHLREVSAACRADAERQFLLDNRVYEGRVGYEVLLPCQLASGSVVLINRGWISAPI